MALRYSKAHTKKRESWLLSAMGNFNKLSFYLSHSCSMQNGTDYKTGLRLSVYLCALSRSHFLIGFHQNSHRRKNPKRKNDFVGINIAPPFPSFCSPKTPFQVKRSKKLMQILIILYFSGFQTGVRGPKRVRAVASFQPNIGGSDISYTSYSTTSPSSLL